MIIKIYEVRVTMQRTVRREREWQHLENGHLVSTVILMLILEKQHEALNSLADSSTIQLWALINI